MEQISINQYFNVKNIWARRLLGLEDFHKNRDLSQIEKEYNLDKYAKLLVFDFKTVEEYKSKEFEQAGLHPILGEIYIALGDDIFKTTVACARDRFYDLLKNTMIKYEAENTCELGCGYGYNLSFIGENSYGGEYSINAVSIAKKIGLNVSQFNYYNEDDYNFIKPETTVFTVHSIEQLPDATLVINFLEKQKNKIKYVVHFEPTVVNERSTLLGLMRNKYMELNDYNRNLISILKSREDIDIIELKTDIIGLIPLNTTNLIVWKFKS
jgi:hypothetical protein